MYKGIDLEKKLDFSDSSIDFDIVLNDLYKYQISNILDDDESVYILADVLYNDYKCHVANYKSYISEGMNARVLMELRKSAILPLEMFGNDGVYKDYAGIETVQDVKNKRIQFFKNINSDYRDEDWQYFLVARCYMCGYTKLHQRMDKDFEEYYRNFWFDYESCYADGDSTNEKTIYDYRDDFVKAHMEGFKSKYT